MAISRIVWSRRDSTSKMSFASGIERRQRADRADEHPHGVRVVPEALEERLDVLVEHRVERDLVRPLFQLGGGRQLAAENQIRRLEEVAALRQLLDGIAAVHQDALVAVDVGDAAAAGGGVGERRVVGHEAELIRRHLDLPEVHRADGAVLQGDLVGGAGSVVGDGERVGHVYSAFFFVVFFLFGWRPGNAVVIRYPAAEIGEPAPLAAERQPRRIDRVAPAIRAHTFRLHHVQRRYCI